LIALFLAGGCGGVGLSSSESALVSDSNEVDDSNDTIETGVEEPLSSAGADDPGAVDPTTTQAQLDVKLKANPGLWFKPAGCIVTTISGNTATSVFTNCTGPLGLHTFNGTVTSTWTFAPNMLTVTHSARGFQIDKATFDHDATIEYTKNGTVYSRHRSGNTSGTTLAGNALNHSFDYTASYDSAAKCITRDGSSNGSLGGLAFSRSIKGYERCGIGEWGCPKSGTITLSRTMPAPELSLSLDFPGGAKVDVTRPNGTTAEYNLICNANF
jgi:hypothetical protein